jgi:endonuclease III
MSATDSAKALNDLLKKLGVPEPVEYPDARDPVAVLVMSMLLYESNTTKAVAAYQKLRTAVVDFNELRVCMPQELTDCVGVRYPLASERCQRLRAALNDIFRREHDVKLAHLSGIGKREVKKYIESLDGITPYAAARVQLLCFDTHAMPADEQLRALLIGAAVIEDSLDVVEVGNWLTRYVKAGEGAAAHSAMQQWVDTGKPVLGKPGRGAGRTGKTRAATTGKTTRRKPSARATSRSNQ